MKASGHKAERNGLADGRRFEVGIIEGVEVDVLGF